MSGSKTFVCMIVKDKKQITCKAKTVSPCLSDAARLAAQFASPYMLTDDKFENLPL